MKVSMFHLLFCPQTPDETHQEKGESSHPKNMCVLFPLISVSLSNECINFTLDFALVFTLKKKRHQTIQNMSCCFGNVGVNEY